MSTLPQTSRRPTVVVIGAGFGGLSTAKALKKAPVRTLVLDRHNYHLFQPLLYQVGTALLDPTDIATPVRSLLRKIPNSEFRQCDVTGVDLDRKMVRTNHGDVPYDYLVVAAGAQTNFFGNKVVERNSVGLKNLDDALTLRTEIIRRFELAKWTEDGDERRRLLSFVVVGGGSTGVETAGAIVEMVKYVMARDYEGLNLADVTVSLLEAGPTILPPYDQKLQMAALERLKWMGVNVLRGSAVETVDDDEIRLTNGNVMHGLLIWTAGVRGADIAGALTDNLARGSRVPVNEFLQLEGRPEVYVVGDVAAIAGPKGTLPQLGPVATQSGKRAAGNIVAAFKGQPLTAFSYWDKGTMSTIGRNAAIVQIGRFRLKGWIGWMSWLFVHLALITNLRSQVKILLNWFGHYLTKDRPARLMLQTYIPQTTVSQDLMVPGPMLAAPPPPPAPAAEPAESLAPAMDTTAQRPGPTQGNAAANGAAPVAATDRSTDAGSTT